MFTKNDDLGSSEVLGNLFEKNESKEAEIKKPFDHDYVVDTASQGLEGVEKLREAYAKGEPYKVVFLDMRMPPGIDGKETAIQMRAIDPDLEIVMVTAYSDHNLEDIVMEVGSPDRFLYLKKPFDPAEIRQIALSLTTKWNEARIKDEFLANVSHELRTPLASIIGFADLLISDKTLSDKSSKYAEIVKNCGSMMSFYINDLITLISLGKSVITLDKEEFCANNLLDEVIEMFRVQIEGRRSLEVIFHKTEGQVLINGDRNRIKQCLINFVSNAIKYTLKGKVDIYCKKVGERIEFTFQDTGIGMAKKDLENIFERFERVEKDHHAIPGLGLGLAICKKIADLHEAEIQVESELDKGTTFKFII
jgi:signal transduction histidine kinase